MTNPSSVASLRRTSKVLGTLLLLSLFVPMLNWTLINSRFLVPNDPAETARRILGQEGLFRLGLVGDLFTSLIALGLGWTLYQLLESVNKPWARLGLGLKTMEGLLLAVIALGNLAVLLMVSDPALASVLELAQVQRWAGVLFNTRMALAAVPMLFLGLDFTVFLALLWKSKFVPGGLAGFGVLAYVLIFVYALLTLLDPHAAANLFLQSACWAPSCLFELGTGVWLLTKGVQPEPGGADG